MNPSDLVLGLCGLIESRHALGPGLIFVDRKETAHALADALQRTLGFEVAWVTSERTPAERVALAERMRAGTLRLVVCTDAWSTGVDIPALRYIILLGDVKAPVFVLQAIGRGLRIDEGKPECEVLNVALPGKERNAAARTRHLEEYGFEVEPEPIHFLDRLDREPDVPAQPEITTAMLWRDFLGPAWLWYLVLAVGVFESIWSCLQD